MIISKKYFFFHQIRNQPYSKIIIKNQSITIYSPCHGDALYSPTTGNSKLNQPVHNACYSALEIPTKVASSSTTHTSFETMPCPFVSEVNYTYYKQGNA